MRGARPVAKRLFKIFDRAAKNELMAFEDGPDSGRNRLSHPPVLTGEIQQRHTHECYFTTPNSARRFIAQADSPPPESAGISSPKLTV